MRLRTKPVKSRSGSVLVLVVIAIVILMASGMAMMAVSYGVRRDSIQAKAEAVSMLAAEAGYERAIFRMSQQPDLLTALSEESFNPSESINIIKPDESGFEGDDSEQTGLVEYTISFDSFMGSRPVYKVSATGRCGMFERTVDVYVIQAVSGWDMGMCRIPVGTFTTDPVNYITGEIIDMPLHINSYGDPFDGERDIHISGSPDFRREVTMSESRYDSGGGDKYSSVINIFDEGIYFLQPSSRILDREAVQQKIDNFKATLQSQKPQYIFVPQVTSQSVTNKMPAVQLEFFVEDNIGKVRITNNCTVRGVTAGTYDYKIDMGYSSLRFQKYNIYGYHYIPQNAEASGARQTHDVLNTYVVPTYAGVEGESGGQIFVQGNVIIGGDKSVHSGGQVLKGRLTVVATGNIWIADCVTVDGEHDSDGVPTENNPNILGLVAQGVIKVVDPGMSEDYATARVCTDVCGEECGWVRVGWSWQYVCREVCREVCEDSVPLVSGMVYEPIGIKDSGGDNCERHLPQSVEVEAAITVGGGGWGAENVGSRKNYISNQNDYLRVRGGITEAVRGIVGYGSNGFKKQYYMDERVLEGILPGDIWLKGKFIPAPAGWHDYRSNL